VCLSICGKTKNGSLLPLKTRPSFAQPRFKRVSDRVQKPTLGCRCIPAANFKRTSSRLLT
jgi:hypothetical protein